MPVPLPLTLHRPRCFNNPPDHITTKHTHTHPCALITTLPTTVHDAENYTPQQRGERHALPLRPPDHYRFHHDLYMTQRNLLLMHCIDGHDSEVQGTLPRLTCKAFGVTSLHIFSHYFLPAFNRFIPFFPLLTIPTGPGRLGQHLRV